MRQMYTVLLKLPYHPTEKSESLLQPKHRLSGKGQLDIHTLDS